jgi:hypothetical protein
MFDSSTLKVLRSLHAFYTRAGQCMLASKPQQRAALCLYRTVERANVHDASNTAAVLCIARRFWLRVLRRKLLYWHAAMALALW